MSFIINWFFLFLDEILFPTYHKIKNDKTVFIIGVPRSATTYLFKLLYQDKKNFHSFKLWEIILAPSICQKYFFLMVKKLDQLIGNPLFRLSARIDQLVFGKLRDIHEIGILKPEEDEALFLFNFSSTYFLYFFPGLKVLDNFLYHDLQVPEKVKSKNLNFYFKCIQRHTYVFDRQEVKYFVSKNPTFIPKMESVAKRFNSAKIIYPIRTPFETIPSTISLNANILKRFCRLPEPFPLQDFTRSFILDWYVHADSVIKNLIKERGLSIKYSDIKDQPEAITNSIYNFLELKKEHLNNQHLERSYRSLHEYDKSMGIDSKEILQKLSGVLDKELLIHHHNK